MNKYTTIIERFVNLVENNHIENSIQEFDVTRLIPMEDWEEAASLFALSVDAIPDTVWRTVVIDCTGTFKVINRGIRSVA
jgi:hypothetical protein